MACCGVYLRQQDISSIIPLGSSSTTPPYDLPALADATADDVVPEYNHTALAPFQSQVLAWWQ